MNYKQRFEELSLVTQRAGVIFTRWLEAGQLQAADVQRVFQGEYHYFVTFSQTNRRHETMRTGFARIVGVESMEEAAALARDTYDGYVEKVHVEYEFDPKLYKRGEIARITANGDQIGETEKVPTKS